MTVTSNVVVAFRAQLRMTPTCSIIMETSPGFTAPIDGNLLDFTYQNDGSTHVLRVTGVFETSSRVRGVVEAPAITVSAGECMAMRTPGPVSFTASP